MKKLLGIMIGILAVSSSLRAGFEPVRSEDWPQTDGERNAPVTNQDDENEDEDRSPASDSNSAPATPDLKRRPDGSLDPDAFKQFM